MDAEQKKEIVKFAEEQIKNNPQMTRDELERLIYMTFYEQPPLTETKATDAQPPELELAVPFALPQPEEAAVKRSLWKRLNWRMRGKKWIVWAALTVLLLLTATTTCYLLNPPGIPWPQGVRNVAKNLGEEEELAIVSEDEKAQYIAQTAEAIRLEGREVFLGRQLADLINDAELAAASVRLLKLGGETAEKDRARITAYIHEHKLVLYCLVENDQMHWQKGPEQERYKRLKDAVLATDKHVDLLYKSMQWDDAATMTRAMDNIRKSYVIVGAFPF